jgi:hypothetical protein
MAAGPAGLRKHSHLIALAIVLVVAPSAAPAIDVTTVGSPPGPRCCPSPADVPPPNPAAVPEGPVLGQLYNPVYNPDGTVAPGDPHSVGADLVVCPCRPIEANCYTRIDYFRWIEPRDGTDQTTESGALYTLGYARRMEGERLRGELFLGTMTFNAALTDSGTADPFQSSTSYIGVRGEYEHLWNVYDNWPAVFLGIGTRAWVRDIRDATSQSGVDVAPGQQTWWTIYPYVGLEKKWLRPNGSELFFSGRLGCTVLTYERTQWPDDPAFYPRPGITGQVELGWRTPRFFVSGYFEAMSWQNSQDEHLHNGSSTDYYYLPAAQMYTTGLKVGLCF